MQSWLSYSRQHPVPQDPPCDVAIVLGYALHRNGSCTRPLQSRVEVGIDLFTRGAARHLIFSGAHPGDALRNVTEANAMLKYALQLTPEPPPGSWLLEEASTSTRTNALFSLALLDGDGDGDAQAGGQPRRTGPAAHTSPAAAAAAGAPAQLQPLLGAAARQAHSWRSVAVVTNPFHQLRSYYVFKRAAQEAGLDIQLFVADAPFAGHCGYGSGVLDALADQLDFWRELAALALYYVRGWL